LYPTPYRGIADLLRQGQAIPFLGAGASLGNRPPGTLWEEASRDFLPRGDELSLCLADITNFPSNELSDRKDLAKVSSYFSEMLGRDYLLERLRGVFHGKDCTPCDIHLYLAELAKSADIAQNADPGLYQEYQLLRPGEYKPLLIVTTNYDNLTELALQDLECPYDLVVHPTDHKDMAGSLMLWKHGATQPTWCRPNALEIDLNKTTVIYKMHGTVSNVLSEFDSYVITEEDYIEFLSLMTSQETIPPLFITHFYTRQFLFLGYGLKDWNFRVMMKNLKEKSRSPAKTPASGQVTQATRNDKNNKRRELKSWAIQNDPSDHESLLWTARDVILFKEDLNKFVAELRRHSVSLVRHVSSKK
jgi:hypothetical protein